MNRAGSGIPYMPRAALQGLGQDDDSDLLDTSDLTDSDNLQSDIDESIAVAPTYDADTGQLIEPSGSPVSGSILANIANSISTWFAPATTGDATLNATGITGDLQESSLLPILLVAGAAGILYLVVSDRN